MSVTVRVQNNFDSRTNQVKHADGVRVWIDSENNLYVEAENDRVIAIYREDKYVGGWVDGDEEDDSVENASSGSRQAVVGESVVNSANGRM